MEDIGSSHREGKWKSRWDDPHPTSEALSSPCRSEYRVSHRGWEALWEPNRWVGVWRRRHPERLTGLADSFLLHWYPGQLGGRVWESNPRIAEGEMISTFYRLADLSVSHPDRAKMLADSWSLSRGVEVFFHPTLGQTLLGL